MDFLRRHMFLIICGVVAASGLTLGAIGLKGMPEVQAEMDKAESVFRSLAGFRSSPVNKGRIEAESQRIDEIMADRMKVFNKAKTLYGYEPLVNDVFPDGEALRRVNFRTEYRARMNGLFDLLNAGSPATAAESRNWDDVIENEREEMRAIGEDPDALTGPEYTPAGVLTVVGAQRNASARAHMAAAQRIYCYGIHFDEAKPPGRTSSLAFSEPLADTTSAEPPFPDEVWWAQVGYWIQKDVVQAIKSVNDEAAEEARKQDIEPWVGIMPVKEVISIRFSESYVPQDGDEYDGDPAGGFGEAIPPGTPETVFTHSGSNSWYEIVQFTLKLVMDQRDILRLVDWICKDSFHTLLRVAYKRVEPNRKMIGKIYGSEPTVNVVMDFETMMLGELFRPLMPDIVCEDFEIDCSERDEP